MRAPPSAMEAGDIPACAFPSGYAGTYRALGTQRAPWQRVLASCVLDPLGLVHTRVAETRADLQAVVPAYSAAVGADGLAYDVRQRYHPGWVAHGVVVSTPRDVVTCYGGVFSGALLSAQSVRAMTTLVHVPGASFRFGPPGYGVRGPHGHRRVAGWSAVGAQRQRTRLPGQCLPRPSIPRWGGHGLRDVRHRGR